MTVKERARARTFAGDPAFSGLDVKHDVPRRGLAVLHRGLQHEGLFGRLKNILIIIGIGTLYENDAQNRE